MPNPMPWETADAGTLRWARYADVGPYVLLAVLAGFSPLLTDPPGETLVVVGLCALAAVWVLVLYTLRPAWRLRPVPMAVFFVGFLAILFALVLIAPWFGFLTPAGYYFAFGVLRWPWRIPGVAAVATAAGVAQASGIPFSGAAIGWHVAIILINAVPMCAFAWIDWHSDLEQLRRQRAMVELSEANRRLEATLAENAALHERLLAQARAAGVHDERQRMAGEIHDTLAQGLTGIITQLQAAEQAANQLQPAAQAADQLQAAEQAANQLQPAAQAANQLQPAAHPPAEPERWRRHVAAATDLARESLREARRSVHALRPEPLRGAPLADALAGVAQRWSARHGIPVEVTTTGDVRPMTPEAELALLRTAQEALANVAAHAGARRVGLTLSYLDGSVALDVRDDGRGFDPAGPPGSAGGYGLVAMRQRIEALAGTLQVESEPRTGTAISAAVPA